MNHPKSLFSHSNEHKHEKLPGADPGFLERGSYMYKALRCEGFCFAHFA